MKLLKAEVTNFASYKKLSFDFSDKDLSLVYGTTGSGKSTLQSIPAWILFGTSAKNGTVDEIKNWQANGEPTIGTIQVTTKDGRILEITRVRGKQQENDLYWKENNGNLKVRGKDLTDTQKLINNLIGMTEEEYSLSACFNEFSPSGSFFLASKKDKRELFEKISDLTLPVKLESETKEYKKAIKKSIDKDSLTLASCKGKLAELIKNLYTLQVKIIEWDKNQKKTIEDISIKAINYNAHKEAILNNIKNEIVQIESKIQPVDHFNQQLIKLQDELNNITTEKCELCGSSKQSEKRFKLQDEIYEIRNAKSINESYISKLKGLKKDLETSDSEATPYNEMLEVEKTKENPFKQLKQEHIVSIENEDAKIKSIESDLRNNQQLLSHVEILNDLSFILRGELLKEAVKEVETKTNECLSKYLGSEFSVSFTLEDPDDFHVLIQKNGYECSFTQLSKGQRQLLKLAFVTSIMSIAANKLGTHQNVLFFDEALDGLDTELKTKAFSLLEELALRHSSIFVVEHTPEFQNLFTNKYHVTMREDCSYIEEEHE